MDENLMNKIKQKIDETISNKQELVKITQKFSSVDDSKSFVFGLVVGRLYNAFYYQSKRILKRDPTESEFDEFLEFLKSKKSNLENLW